MREEEEERREGCRGKAGIQACKRSWPMMAMLIETMRWHFSVGMRDWWWTEPAHLRRFLTGPGNDAGTPPLPDERILPRSSAQAAPRGQ